MAIVLKGRSLLTLKNFSKDEIRRILDVSHQVKANKKPKGKTLQFTGKCLAMIFEKLSTRTRCAFETAFAEEGGHPVMLSKNDIHLGVKETVADTARVLGRMFDGISFRGFKQETVEKLAEYSNVPVYNGLTDQFHPTQALADIMTIEEAFETIENRKIVYIGDVLNTTARIQEDCKRLDKEFLISESLLNQVAGLGDIKASFVEETIPRGKEEKVKLYSRYKGTGQ